MTLSEIQAIKEYVQAVSRTCPTRLVHLDPDEREDRYQDFKKAELDLDNLAQ